MSSEHPRDPGTPGTDEPHGRVGPTPEEPDRAAGAPSAAADAEAQNRSKAAELAYQGTEIAGRATD
ncbi:hypothetical protein, partial [Streptomyces sp. NPDC001919]